MRIWLALAAFVLAGCIAGEDGKDGEDGRGYQANVYTGVLYSTDRKVEESVSYWDKTYFTIGEKSVVTVHVRQGGGYMWITPTWYLSTSGSYVRIIDDERVEPAWEFRVVVGN